MTPEKNKQRSVLSNCQYCFLSRYTNCMSYLRDDLPSELVNWKMGQKTYEQPFFVNVYSFFNFSGKEISGFGVREFFK